MTYVDGFVIRIPRKNLKAYKKMAQMGKKMWMEHGALDYKECVLEDPTTFGGITFTRLAKAKAGQTVVFSYITFKSKSHRNAVNAKVMKDPRMEQMPKEMPFGMKDMAYGGFEAFVG